MTNDRPAADALRVCLFTRTWRSSGAGLFAQELVDGMLTRGAHVTFIAPPLESAAAEGPRRGLVRLRQPRELGPEASKPRRILRSLARVAGGALALAKARAGNTVFIVSIPDPLVFAVPMLALLRLSGGRIVFVAHDPTPHAWRLPRALRRLELAAHAACYRLASAVVVLSQPSADKLRSAFPRVRTPIRVIEHGVFVLRDQRPLPGDGTLLVFGTLRRNKGILEAIEGVIAAAAAGLAVRLIVAGELHSEDRSYGAVCLERARTAPAIVELHPGYVADDMLSALIARSDALLMPYSAFFSQSGVAILAASNARPVIATAAGGIGSLIAEGMPAVTIASPPSAEAVASAVHAFLATPMAEWRKRAEQYQAFTQRHRSWPVIAGHYLTLARDVQDGQY